MEQKEKLDLVEVAEYCVNEFKTECQEDKHGKDYVKTDYFAISEDDVVTHSSIPLILKNAHRCILIHNSYELAATIWYNHYRFQYIDEMGNVHDNHLDENYVVGMSPERFGHDASMSLYRCKAYQTFGMKIVTFSARLVSKVSQLWEIYLRSRECKSEGEVEIMAKLIKAEYDIKALKGENDSLKYANALLEKEKEEHEKFFQKLNGLLDTDVK